MSDDPQYVKEHFDEQDRITAEYEDKTGPIQRAALARQNQRKINPHVWYFVREYSGSESFPEAHIFQTEDEARRKMIAEALEAAVLLDGWVTEDMDESDITACLQNGWGTFHTRVTSLNVQQEGGAVDCFRLMSQEVR